MRPMLGKALRACALLVAMALPASAELVTLQSMLTGQSVSVDASGLLAVRRGPALTLDMIRLNGNRVAFRDPQSGLFLRAGIGSQTQLGVASEHIRAWETFELREAAAGVSLLSVQSGAFVGFDGIEPRLNARWGTQGLGQTFRLVPAAAAVAPASLPFAGNWTLHDLFSSYGLDARLLQVASLRIGASGALNGQSGCNSFQARLNSQGSDYRVDDFLTTRVRCSGWEGTIETMYYAALTDTVQVTMVGNRLELRDRQGILRARFVRR